jgi:hypothetical protein
LAWQSFFIRLVSDAAEVQAKQMPFDKYAFCVYTGKFRLGEEAACRFPVLAGEASDASLRPGANSPDIPD